VQLQFFPAATCAGAFPSQALPLAILSLPTCLCARARLGFASASFVFGSLGLRPRFCFADLRCSQPVRPRAEGAVCELLQSSLRRSRSACRANSAFLVAVFCSCLRFRCSPPPLIFLLACACLSVAAPPRVAALRFRFSPCAALCFLSSLVLEPLVLGFEFSQFLSVLL
jgi:hypothetical protein